MKLHIRLATPTDAPQVHAIYTPIVEHTTISFELVPPSVEEIAERIRAIITQHAWLVCVEGETILGYAYASTHRTRAAYQWAVDVSAYVHANARKRGIGRGLYTALFQICAAQGYYAAYAGITQPNPASVGLHEAVGFTPVGMYHEVGYKHGAWHDVGWWQHSLRPREPEPTAPAPIHAIVDTEAWNAALAAGEACFR